VAITTDTAATTTPSNALVLAATKLAANVLVRTLDGTYGITSFSALAAPTATGDLLRVRYGSTSSTTALTIVPAATASTTGTGSVVGTGDVGTSNAAKLPLTTKSVTFNMKATVTGTTPATPRTGYALYYELSYGTSCLAADYSPVKTTAPVKVLTDSTGTSSVTVTSLKPADGCVVTVIWTGMDSAASVTQTATWQAPIAARADVSTGSYEALTKTSHTITWTVTDQFGAPFAD